MKSSTVSSASSDQTFEFWLPPEGKSLSIGPDKEDLIIPQIPLPILSKDFSVDASPGEKAIGDGLYEYLLRFPECEHAAEYAAILKDAYPFFISDIGSQLIVMDVKQTDAEGTDRKIAMLKILHYLEPENFGLLHKTGLAYYDLALDYSRLLLIDENLKNARLWLERARRVEQDNPANLNYLGQVCYLNGNYPQARLYWKLALKVVDEEKTVAAISRQLDNIATGNLPQEPLAKALKDIGVALEHFAAEEFAEACRIMENIFSNTSLPAELPSPDFFYFLGLSREKCHNPQEALAAFNRALEINPEHQPAIAARAKLAT